MPHLPVLTYGSKTWAVGKKCENLLRYFDGKVLRKIFDLYLKMDVGGGTKTLKYVSFMMNMMLCNVLSLVELRGLDMC